MHGITLVIWLVFVRNFCGTSFLFPSHLPTSSDPLLSCCHCFFYLTEIKVEYIRNLGFTLNSKQSKDPDSETLHAGKRAKRRCASVVWRWLRRRLMRHRISMPGWTETGAVEGCDGILSSENTHVGIIVSAIMINPTQTVRSTMSFNCTL